MPEQHYPEVRALGLFSGMTDENFFALMREAHASPPQIELISEGEPSDFLHARRPVGIGRPIFAMKGRDTSLATVRPISTFILAATIKNAPYLMSARRHLRKAELS